MHRVTRFVLLLRLSPKQSIVMTQGLCCVFYHILLSLWVFFGCFMVIFVVFFMVVFAVVVVIFIFFPSLYRNKRGSPVDRRPSTAEAPPMCKIHPFSKNVVTLESVMQFECPSGFRIYFKILT